MPARSCWSSALDDLAALRRPARFDAHLSLGGGLDPTWLDLFSEAARTRAPAATSRSTSSTPASSSTGPARRWASGPSSGSTRPGSARSPASPTPPSTPIAGRWIDLVEEELGALPREEKPWIRDLAGQVVRFCRRADRAPDVLFAWSLR